MRRMIAAVVSASSIVSVFSVLMAADTNGLTSTGLFPVYDSSGETHGDDLAGYLTPAIYQAFKEAGRELVLMNPGGSYSLLDEAASLDYGRSAGVQVVLMSRLAPTRRLKPDDASPSLQVEVKAVDVASGTTLAFLYGQPAGESKGSGEGFRQRSRNTSVPGGAREELRQKPDR